MTKTTRTFKPVIIAEGEDATSVMHKTRENFRRKSLSTYIPDRGTFGPLKQADKLRVLRKVENRLRLNLQQGRNAGHHQQLAYNATGSIVPA